MPARDSLFLRTVSEFNSRFNALRFGTRVESLNHSFWTIEEIQSAAQMTEEWDVPQGLTPFYGDWHELFCLNEAAGTVVYLNDEREVVFTWPSRDDFIAALAAVEEESSSNLGIVEDETWFDF